MLIKHPKKKWKHDFYHSVTWPSPLCQWFHIPKPTFWNALHFFPFVSSHLFAFWRPYRSVHSHPLHLFSIQAFQLHLFQTCLLPACLLRLFSSPRYLSHVVSCNIKKCSPILYEVLRIYCNILLLLLCLYIHQSTGWTFSPGSRIVLDARDILCAYRFRS